MQMSPSRKSRLFDTIAMRLRATANWLDEHGDRSLSARTRAYVASLGEIDWPKIEAIKFVRREANMSLKDSKEFVEAHLPELNRRSNVPF